MLNDIKSRYYIGISNNLVMKMFVIHILQKFNTDISYEKNILTIEKY